LLQRVVEYLSFPWFLQINNELFSIVDRLIVQKQKQSNKRSALPIFLSRTLRSAFPDTMKSSINNTQQTNTSMSTVRRAATATATVLFLLASSNVPSCDAFALTTPSSRGGVLTTPSSTSTSLNDKKSSSSKKARASPGGFASKLQEMRASKFPYAGEVRPGQQSPQRQVLDSTITRPDYADTGVPVRGNKPMLPWIVEVKNAEQVEKMRASGKLARYILDLGGRQVKPGVTTDEIDKVVHDAVVAVRYVILCYVR
jgi:hypothetical protein